MLSAKINIAFEILRELKKELTTWLGNSLSEIDDKNVEEVIELLKIFMRLKKDRRNK